MNLLFVSMSARIILDDKGNAYLNSHMNRESIKRYADICNNLTLVLRDSGIRCSEEEAKARYNEFPFDLADLEICFNPYQPITNFFSVHKYKQFKKTVFEKVEWADRVIIASATGIYSNETISACKKLKKPYLLLVGGFAFETDWNHGIEGKFFAFKHEYDCRRNIKAAPYVLYVTQKALQERYPTRGKSIGCSDVEIDIDMNCVSILEQRKARIANQNNKIIIGTAAGLDFSLKGQCYVIDAIEKLNQISEVQFIYEMIGSGKGDVLKEYSKKKGIEKQITIRGAIPHNEVYDWFKSIDIYVQPSYIEGLCRSVVEAMSLACPVICTSVGGNPELCSTKYLVPPKNSDALVNAILSLVDSEEQYNEALKSFERAQNYTKARIDSSRRMFLHDFMKGVLAEIGEGA